MLFPILSVFVGGSLLCAPMAWPELPARAALAAAAGLVAITCGVFGIASPRARLAVAVAGAVVAAINFVLPGGIAVLAFFAAHGIGLVIGGLGTMPRTSVPTGLEAARRHVLAQPQPVHTPEQRTAA